MGDTRGYCAQSGQKMTSLRPDEEKQQATEDDLTKES